MGCHDIVQVIKEHLINDYLLAEKNGSFSIVSFYYLMLVCSNEDFEVMDQIFLTTKGPNLEFFLENDYHYRLRIHTKDFELGRTIDSNIEEAITHSRRLIVLLSR